MIYQIIKKRTEILAIATSLITYLRNYYNHVFALVISMRVLLALIFVKIDLKLS